MRKFLCLVMMFIVVTAGYAGTVVLDLPLPPAIKIGKADVQKTSMVNYPLKVEQVAGKRVTVTAEVKRNINILYQKWQGGKLMLMINGPTGAQYPGVYMPQGEFDWTKLSLIYDVPAKLTGVNLCMGIQGAEGEIAFRNVKVEVGDSVLDFSGAANMGFKDKVARDGQGGWSDQGPDNDAAGFPLKRKEFANVAFRIINPEQNNGKAVLVFRSANFSKGLEQAQFSLTAAPTTGKYLYLLHTLTFGHNAKSAVGSVTVTGKNGKTMTFSVMPGP